MLLNIYALADFIEYAAVATVLAGVWLIGKMDIRGQYLMALSQLLWFSTGLIINQTGLMIQSLVLFILAIRAIGYWRKMNLYNKR